MHIPHRPTARAAHPAIRRWASRLAAGTCLATVALAASAQQDLSCEQIAAEMKALATGQAAAAPNADAAAVAAGAQVLGALASRGGGGGGLGGMFGGLVGGGARPAAQVQAAQAVQLLAVAQAVQGASSGQAADGTQAAQATAVQAAALQALAQQRGAGVVNGGQAAQAAGVVGLLGGLMAAAQAQAPVATPGNAAIAELAGSRQEQLGGLFLAKGCKAPG